MNRIGVVYGGAGIIVTCALERKLRRRQGREPDGERYPGAGSPRAAPAWSRVLQRRGLQRRVGESWTGE